MSNKQKKFTFEIAWTFDDVTDYERSSLSRTYLILETLNGLKMALNLLEIVLLQATWLWSIFQNHKEWWSKFYAIILIGFLCPWQGLVSWRTQMSICNSKVHISGITGGLLEKKLCWTVTLPKLLKWKMKIKYKFEILPDV